MTTITMQSRIQRFRSGMSIFAIAKQDGIEPKTLYNNLLKAKVISSSYLAEMFFTELEKAGLPRPEREYQFVHHAPVEIQASLLSPKTRRVRGWKTDGAYPYHQLAVEVDGGIHLPGGGRHGDDRDKRNGYALCGWRVLYFDADMVLKDLAGCIRIMRLALMGRE